MPTRWRQLLLAAGVVAIGIAGLCVVMALRQGETRSAERLRIAGPSNRPNAEDIATPGPVPAPPITTSPSAQVPFAARSPGPAQVTTISNPVEEKTLEISWSDGDGGAWRTRITFLPAVDTGQGPVQYADVATRQVGEQRDQILYRARVSRGSKEHIICDARGAAVSGPLAQDWIPDSFTIAADDSVRIDDGMHRPNEGWVVQTTRVSPSPLSP
jgi:hypothetical protein